MQRNYRKDMFNFVEDCKWLGGCTSLDRSAALHRDHAAAAASFFCRRRPSIRAAQWPTAAGPVEQQLFDDLRSGEENQEV
jgi:hypothetical protein